MTPQNRLEYLLKESQVLIQQQVKRKGVLSFLRLFVFLTAFLGAYFLWDQVLVVSFFLILSFAIFLILVRLHAISKEKLETERAVESCVQEELEILKGNWRSRESGAQYANPEHPYSSDLNIFGSHSIFQYLNRARTNYAATRFADWLKTPILNSADIQHEQVLIKELSAHPELFIRIRALAGFVNIDAQNMKDIENWSRESRLPYSKAAQFVYTAILPLYSIAAITLFIAGILSFNLLVFALVLPAACALVYFKKHGEVFNRLVLLLSSVDRFRKILNEVLSAPIESPEYNKLIQSAKLGESPAALRELDKIVGAVESRNNPIVGIGLNLLLLWDFQCMRRLHTWKKKYAANLPDWLETASILESYGSFALYAFGHPKYNYPQIVAADDLIIDEARHVLMDAGAVPNSLDISSEKRFYIITGANMAGKSTYLRTVGTSLVLAMRGLPLSVGKMRFKPRMIFTSMLAADSLGENESYFFNELKRLRQMTDLLEQDIPLFVILDEILKGTNSVDKAQGSAKFVEKLLGFKAKGLIATHDLSLCELSGRYPAEIDNTKFEVGFHKDELVFNYKLEKGICQNMNASFLLKKMGLTD